MSVAWATVDLRNFNRVVLAPRGTLFRDVPGTSLRCCAAEPEGPVPHNEGLLIRLFRKSISLLAVEQ